MKRNCLYYKAITDMYLLTTQKFLINPPSNNRHIHRLHLVLCHSLWLTAWGGSEGEVNIYTKLPHWYIELHDVSRYPGVVCNSVPQAYHSCSSVKYYVIPWATRKKLDMKRKHSFSHQLYLLNCKMPFVGILQFSVLSNIMQQQVHHQHAGSLRDYANTLL